MLKQLQPFQRKSALYQTIFDAEGVVIDNKESLVNEVRLQASVDTATWGLEIFEKELGIPKNPSKTIAERRSLIKSKMRGFGKADIALIKLVAESFENGEISVEYGPVVYSYDTNRAENFNPPYTIKIRFIDSRGIPTNIDDLISMINEVKPAHIRAEYLFKFLTWDELEAQNLTWDELDALNLTWEEFETGAWMT